MAKRRTVRGRRWRSPLARFWTSARWRRRAWRALKSAPLAFQLVAGGMVVLMLWATTNWLYQVARKPAELFFPVSGVLDKTPAQTWRSYGSIFEAHATAIITADFLAALAQVEASGNPVARTYWRWQATWDPFGAYRPASSAVGMYQITDATFAEAKRYCIHDHAVAEDGPWHELRSCWFNAFYLRIVPTHAVEMTSALLDRRVMRTLARAGITSATLDQKQDLAAVIHLCGPSAGEAYAARGFRLMPGQRCGDHDTALYLAKINGMKRVFARMVRAR